jgi:intracellular multiplication protein IcmO
MAYERKGVGQGDEIGVGRRRLDTRRTRQKIKDLLNSRDGALYFCGIVMAVGFLSLIMPLPFFGELLVLITWLFARSFFDFEKRLFDYPYRLPQHSGCNDGSQAVRNGKPQKGNGIFMLGNELPDSSNSYTQRQIWAGNSDLRTHMLVLGTTGSGKTEFLLGLFVNAMVINSGFIMCDGKGDPNLQRNIFRLARRFGREDDLLIINFITSGRDFFDKQYDSVTNNMNLFGNTSSGMLIELLVSLMDDSGGGGDMWKGRAISFVAALTRVLVYLRDMGHINLSADVFIKYFEMGDLFELCFEHEGVYGEKFEVVSMALKTYLKTLPGFQEGKKKKQETKTLEQHGFIVMQLTRIFNDLNFNYGHIFNTRVGEIDFFDVVINNRILITLLPALERAPDTLKMLGKLIVGNIKQMMAGCLGNRVEGLVREIIDSRPTNSPVPTTCVLDEYGYYAVVGFAVAPAQARSLGFFICFSAQDFSSLKKASAEEADATWENTNIRAVGRLTSGAKSETMERIAGAAGEAVVSISSGDESVMGAMGYKYRAQQNVAYDKTNRIDYNDLAQQSDGDFTFIIGKKAGGGKSGGVAVIMGQGFYAATESPMHMRINTFVPVEAPTENDLPRQKKGILALKQFTESPDASPDFLTTKLEGSPILSSLAGLMSFCEILSQKGNAISPTDAICAWLAARSSDNCDVLMDALDKKISEVLRGKTVAMSQQAAPKKIPSESAPAAPSSPSASQPTAAAVSSSTSLLGAEAVNAAIEQDTAYITSVMQRAIENPELFNEQLDDRDFDAADVGEGGESTPHETLTHDDYPVEDFSDDDMQMDSYGDGLEPVAATSFYSGVKPSMASLMGGNPHKPLSQYTLAIDAVDMDWKTTTRHSTKTAVALNLAANSGKPFSSRNEVFAVESDSEALQVSLHHQTAYISKPIPEEQDPVEFKQKSKQLNDAVKAIMNNSSFLSEGDDE